MLYSGYPLVMTNITMGNPHFDCENSRFQWLMVVDGG